MPIFTFAVTFLDDELLSLLFASYFKVIGSKYISILVVDDLVFNNLAPKSFVTQTSKFFAYDLGTTIIYIIKFT